MKNWIFQTETHKPFKATLFPGPFSLVQLGKGPGITERGCIQKLPILATRVIFCFSWPFSFPNFCLLCYRFIFFPIFPSFSFFLIPQILIGSITLSQKFTPHFKILDPRLGYVNFFLRSLPVPEWCTDLARNRGFLLLFLPFCIVVFSVYFSFKFIFINSVLAVFRFLVNRRIKTNFKEVLEC